MSTKRGNKAQRSAAQRINMLRSLSHTDKPVDTYSKYLSLSIKPRDGFSNPNNLFDDSNSEDRKWLKIAMKYLDRFN